MNDDFSALAERINDALADLDRVVSRAEASRDKATLTSDDAYWDAVALNLHGFYAGVEMVFVDIAQVLEGRVPSGPEWHIELLTQMSEAVPDTRSNVIAEDTRRCLDEYRRLRHVVRNVYTFNLRPARLNELANALRSCFEALTRDLKEFTAFLELIAQSDDLPTDTEE